MFVYGKSVCTKQSAHALPEKPSHGITLNEREMVANKSRVVRFRVGERARVRTCVCVFVCSLGRNFRHPNRRRRHIYSVVVRRRVTAHKLSFFQHHILYPFNKYIVICILYYTYGMYV